VLKFKRIFRRQRVKLGFEISDKEKATTVRERGGGGRVSKKSKKENYYELRVAIWRRCF
jgi:hypothetical protein